jgi:glycosyltransferase involved in cell wall biosynthesis
MPKLIRVTTVPMALKVLLSSQLKYMKDHNFEVIMVSADGKERKDVIQNEQVPHYVIPMTRKITPFADLISLWRLYKFLKKENPDIVHSHTPKAGLLAMLAAKLAGIQIRIHTVAGLRFMTATGSTRRVLIQMEKLTGKWATHVWPNSFSLQEFIRKNNLVNADKLEVIGLGSSNGINLSRFSTQALKNERLDIIKKHIKYDDSLTYLLCVGRIVKDKGVDELLYAFSKTYEKNKNLRLIMVGPFEDDLDPVSEESKRILRSHSGIILAGWSDEVEYFMHLSFALIHASHREGFPNVLLQAGAMLCPVICSSIEGNVDIVEHKKTGLLFEVKNKESLLMELEKGLADPESLKQYARELRSKIELHFAQEVIHQRLHQRYNELLHNQS